MSELQKNLDSTVVEAVTKTLEDWAVTAGQPTVTALESLLDEKLAVCEQIQRDGMKAIANAQGPYTAMVIPASPPNIFGDEITKSH